MRTQIVSLRMKQTAQELLFSINSDCLYTITAALFKEIERKSVQMKSRSIPRIGKPPRI